MTIDELNCEPEVVQESTKMTIDELNCDPNDDF
jgi:hypothetical protein